MAVIAGVGYKTIFRLVKRKSFLRRGMKNITNRVEGDRHREGDGRVPLASASLENVQIRYVRTVHGGMPNVPAVYEAALRFLNREDMGLAETAQAALTGHLADGSRSVAPHLDGSATAQPYSDDPGFLDPKPPTKAEMNAMFAKLDQGALVDFRTVRLL